MNDFLLFFSGAGYGLTSGTCSACFGGTISLGGISTCLPCQIGQYAAPITGSCTSCPLNFFAATTGTTICTPCIPGSISPMQSSGCTACSAGTYATPNACLSCMGTGIVTCGPIFNTANTW